MERARWRGPQEEAGELVGKGQLAVLHAELELLAASLRASVQWSPKSFETIFRGLGMHTLHWHFQMLD